MRKASLIKWTLVLGSLTVTAWRMPDIMETVGKSMNPAMIMGMKSGMGGDALSLLQAQASAVSTADPLKVPSADELVIYGAAGLSEAQKAALLREAARRSPAQPPASKPSFGGGKASPVRGGNPSQPSDGPMDGITEGTLEELTRELQKVMQKGG